MDNVIIENSLLFLPITSKQTPKSGDLDVHA